MRTRHVALAVLAFAALPSGAVADCTCRAEGVVAKQGELVCLATPRGPRMARCDKVLNNSSWTFLERFCPVIADIGPAERAVHRPAEVAWQPERR